MRPLTDDRPKPLLDVAGRPLIEWTIERLAGAGMAHIVINTSWLGEMIPSALGDGSRWGVRISYSYEEAPPLETGGGIHRALPLLGESAFVVVNGDVWMNPDFRSLRLDGDDLAHLLMVPNPGHNPDGDFRLDGDRLSDAGEDRVTYSGVGVFHPQLFADCQPGRFPLAPLLVDAMKQSRVAGTLFDGWWRDIGTAERLESLRSRLLSQTDPATR